MWHNRPSLPDWHLRSRPGCRISSAAIHDKTKKKTYRALDTQPHSKTVTMLCIHRARHIVTTHTQAATARWPKFLFSPKKKIFIYIHINFTKKKKKLDVLVYAEKKPSDENNPTRTQFPNLIGQTQIGPNNLPFTYHIICIFNVFRAFRHLSVISFVMCTFFSKRAYCRTSRFTVSQFHSLDAT